MNFALGFLSGVIVTFIALAIYGLKKKFEQ